MKARYFWGWFDPGEWDFTRDIYPDVEWDPGCMTDLRWGPSTHIKRELIKEHFGWCAHGYDLSNCHPVGIVAWCRPHSEDVSPDFHFLVDPRHAGGIVAAGLTYMLLERLDDLPGMEERAWISTFASAAAVRLLTALFGFGSEENDGNPEFLSGEVSKVCIGPAGWFNNCDLRKMEFLRNMVHEQSLGVH